MRYGHKFIEFFTSDNYSLRCFFLKITKSLGKNLSNFLCEKFYKPCYNNHKKSIQGVWGFLGKGYPFMLQLGSLVVYGIHGVCTILEIEQRTVDRKKVEYYVLTPKDQPAARFYVPTQNQAALSKLRPLLTKEALDQLLVSNDTYQDCWIQDENRRKQKYKELINSGDRAALISMIRSLYKHKENQLAQGRKFHLCDENFLRDAQKLLVSEFSHVLGILPNEVPAYVESRIQK